MRIAAVVVLALAAASCTKGPAPAPPLTGFDERQACSVDDDCVAVEVECCDACNGGTAVGVHRDHAKDVEREYRGPDRCEGTACTLRACEPPVAICRQDRCGVSIQGQEQLTPLPRR